jgi:glycosyltransferase involved in cell wall biosynthesis
MGRGDVTDGLPRVLALVAEADGPSAWRIFQPFAALTSRGYPAADWDWKDNPLLGELVATGRYDAVILPRLSWNDADEAAAERWMAALHRAGLAVIYEVDDDFFSPQFLRQQRQAGLEAARGKSDAELDAQRLARIRALQRCDGVTVSSSRLATVVRQYVAADMPVCVVPNAIDWQWHRAVLAAWRSAAQTAARVKPALVPPSNTVTIGWAGGARPDADVLLMAQAWAAVGKMRPQTRFVVQGYHPTAIDEALAGAALAAERVEWRPWLPLEQYPAGLAGVQIACAPLADTPFARCKTPIKVMEAAALGAAVVASPTVYGSVIVDGESGALCRTVDEWTAALLRLVDEPRTRRQWARALRHRVEKHHTLEGNLWRWPAAWQTILEAFRKTHTRRLLAC